MDLLEKIKSMREFLDVEEIAKAIDIPAEIIRGVIDGSIDEDILKEYDVEKPPEIRVVEQKRFLRSQVTGVIGTNNTDVSIVTALLAVEVANRYKGDVALIDLGETPVQPALMDMEDIDTAMNLNFVVKNEELKRKGATHHKINNLAVYKGAASSVEHREIDGNRMQDIISSISSNYGLSVVECPAGLTYWDSIINQLDFIIVVVEQNYMGMSKYRHIFNLLKELNVIDRALVILTKDGESGGYNLYESKRAIRSNGKLEVIGELPYDSRLYKREYILNREIKYETIKKVADLIIPSSSVREKSGGILSKLFGGK